MKKKYVKGLGLGVLSLSLFLAACSNEASAPNDETEQSQTESVESNEETSQETNEQTSEASDQTGGTVEVEDVHGTVEVPVNPEKVVALDNRTFETLDAWGVDLVAAPKTLIPEDISYSQDEAVADVGNHREPNLEVIAAAEPDLVIVGQRFAQYYEDIKDLVPDAAVVDFTFDVSEEAENPSENLVNGLKQSNAELGKIFQKEEEAQALADELDQSIEAATAAYNGEDTVMAVIVSGGEIGYSAPGSGRVWGPVYDIIGWQPALVTDDASSDHTGDDVSVEAIAQSNPDWLMVLDRDAAAGDGSSAPAEDVIEGATALQNTTAIQEGNVYYAPADTYTNESIQTWTEIFNGLAEAMQ